MIRAKLASDIPEFKTALFIHAASEVDAAIARLLNVESLATTGGYDALPTSDALLEKIADAKRASFDVMLLLTPDNPLVEVLERTVEALDGAVQRVAEVAI
jgi:hypothetical protein